MNPTGHVSHPDACPEHCAKPSSARRRGHGAASVCRPPRWPISRCSRTPACRATVACRCRWSSRPRSAWPTSATPTARPTSYLGYFDADKCYKYSYDATDAALGQPLRAGGRWRPAMSARAKWSGNFLNWATMQTIDPFRWALTGGYRVVDTASATILEKAWGVQPGRHRQLPRTASLTARGDAGSDAVGQRDAASHAASRASATRCASPWTPAPARRSAATALRRRGRHQRQRARHAARSTSLRAGQGVRHARSAASRPTASPTGGQLQARGPDPAVRGQDALQRLRLPQRRQRRPRDGGVLRARQKFVGPTQPVPGQAA